MNNKQNEFNSIVVLDRIDRIFWMRELFLGFQPQKAAFKGPNTPRHEGHTYIINYLVGSDPTTDYPLQVPHDALNNHVRA